MQQKEISGWRVVGSVYAFIHLCYLVRACSELFFGLADPHDPAGRMILRDQVVVAFPLSLILALAIWALITKAVGGRWQVFFLLIAGVVCLDLVSNFLSLSIGGALVLEGAMFLLMSMAVAAVRPSVMPKGRESGGTSGGK